MQPINRKKVSLTLILSAEDNKGLEDVAFALGLKKSEFLRSIIQGISMGNKVAETMSHNKNVKVEVDGYGFSIPTDTMNELLQEVSERLTKAIEITELRPQKTQRIKRMKPMAQAS